MAALRNHHDLVRDLVYDNGRQRQFRKLGWLFTAPRRRCWAEVEWDALRPRDVLQHVRFSRSATRVVRERGAKHRRGAQPQEHRSVAAEKYSNTRIEADRISGRILQPAESPEFPFREAGTAKPEQLDGVRYAYLRIVTAARPPRQIQFELSNKPPYLDGGWTVR